MDPFGQLKGNYFGLWPALNCYINEPLVSHSRNLMQDTEFISVTIFKGIVKEITTPGKDKTTHHPLISPEDHILKYSAILSPDNPK